MTNNMMSTTIRLPEELHETLTQIAEEERRSFNSQVIYMLERSVAEYQNREDRDDA